VPQLTFLEKLNTVEVPESSYVSTEDRDEIRFCLKQRQDVFEQLSVWENALHVLSERLPLPTAEDDAAPWLNLFKFDPEQKIAGIAENRRNVHEQTVGRLVSHFNVKYQLKMSMHAVAEALPQTFSEGEFVSELVRYADGLLLRDKAVQLVIAEVAKEFRNIEFSRNGCKVTGYFARYNPLYNGKFNINYNMIERLVLLGKAICVAAGQQSTDVSELEKLAKKWWNDPVPFGQVHQLPLFGVDVGIRFYQNGRVDLTFDAEYIALKLCNMLCSS